MTNLSFQKFKNQINERRYIGPEGTKEFNKLSPKLKSAVRDVYVRLDKAADPLLGKIEGIINQVAKKHNIKVSNIEKYIDTEIIK
jgi:hypothetical protein